MFLCVRWPEGLSSIIEESGSITESFVSLVTIRGMSDCYTQLFLACFEERLNVGSVVIIRVAGN